MLLVVNMTILFSLVFFASLSEHIFWTGTSWFQQIKSSKILQYDILNKHHMAGIYN